jgi:mevalonate pyrophosphate decarboxylase
MPRKSKSDGGSEQAEKKQRDKPAAAAAVPSSAAARAAHAAALMEKTHHQSLQAIECSKLARYISKSDARPLDERAADVMKLLEEDSKRDQPLLNLSHKLAVN